MSSFLAKPFNPDELLRVIQEAVAFRNILAPSATPLTEPGGEANTSTADSVGPDTMCTTTHAIGNCTSITVGADTGHDETGCVLPSK